MSGFGTRPQRNDHADSSNEQRPRRLYCDTGALDQKRTVVIQAWESDAPHTETREIMILHRRGIAAAGPTDCPSFSSSARRLCDKTVRSRWLWKTPVDNWPS
jgi:hypothetical protein